MLTPEATETPIPLTGEVRPKIGPTAQTGTRAASDDAGRAGLAQRLRKGSRQCGHIRHSPDPEGRTGRPSGECQLKVVFLNDGPGLLLGSMWNDYAYIENINPDRIRVVTLRMVTERVTPEWLRS